MSESIATKNPLVNGKLVAENVPRSTYCQSEIKRGQREFVMSRGELTEFNRCPHRWLAGYESDETKASEWGCLLDCLALTPDRFDEEFAVTPSHYVNSKGETKPWNFNSNTCKAWRDEHDGLQIVKPDLMTDAHSAVKVLFADPQISALLKCSKKQVMATASYYDPAIKLIIPLKVLIDLVPHEASQFAASLADLKSCATASPFPWTRAVFERGYHVQAALYLDVYEAATGENRNTFLHVLQENYAPWEVGKRILSQEFIELGRLAYLTALERYCLCLSESRWPGYDDEGKMILNGWQLTEPEAWMIGRA